MSILAGYKFKPSHSDIHYLSLSDQTEVACFSTNIKLAIRFPSQSEATRAIYSELADFTEDDDYEWTPVLTDETGSEVGSIRPFFRVGTPQFREQDLPHFLNISE